MSLFYSTFLKLWNCQKFVFSWEQVWYLKSGKEAVVLGADVGATAEGGYGDGMAVQYRQVVAVPTVWVSAAMTVFL